jgi:hypothetical protein
MHDLKTIKEIARLMGAEGKSCDEICQLFNMTEEDFNHVMTDQEFGNYLLNAQTAAKIPMGIRLATAAELAYQRRMRLMLDARTDVKTVEKISQDFMDRAHGRPVQRTESYNVNVNGSNASSIEDLDSEIDKARKQTILLENSIKGKLKDGKQL